MSAPRFNAWAYHDAPRASWEREPTGSELLSQLELQERAARIPRAVAVLAPLAAVAALVFAFACSASL